DRRRIGVAGVVEQRPPGLRPRLGALAHHLQVEFDAAGARALGEQATVADHPQRRPLDGLPLGEETRHQLGADAGGIADDEGETYSHGNPSFTRDDRRTRNSRGLPGPSHLWYANTGDQ